MNNCLECNEANNCTKCDLGFEIQAGICKEPELNIGAIVGGVVGGFVLITSIVFIISKCYGKCRLPRTSTYQV